MRAPRQGHTQLEQQAAGRGSGSHPEREGPTPSASGITSLQGPATPGPGQVQQVRGRGEVAGSVLPATSLGQQGVWRERQHWRLRLAGVLFLWFFLLPSSILLLNPGAARASVGVRVVPGDPGLLLGVFLEIERNCCVLYRQQKLRCHFSGSRAKDQRHTKSPCLRTCLMICFKDQARMEQREPTAHSHVKATDGRLRELASKWFIETQAPLIVHNGFFPTWFLGFITRKEAEEILRKKELGSFLIRLSEKVIGYILSYRGRDRCRHFVINQSESGQFLVSGDTEGHDSVSDLIKYYTSSPIQPFGEYLASSCFEALDKDLYDIIQVCPREDWPVANVRAVNNMLKPQINSASEQPPARPPKNNRTLEATPPLPRRSRPLESDPLNVPDRVLYAQLSKQSPREIPICQHICQDNFPGENIGRAERSTTQDQSRCSPPSVYSELNLLESKSRSLPLLDNISDAEQSNRLSAPPHTPPRLSPKPIRQTTSLGPSSCHSPEYTSVSAFYELAGQPGSPHTTSSGTRSAEVPNEAVVGRFTHDNIYQLISGHKDTATPEPDSNTYESVKDIRPKHKNSYSGLKNDTWKWLFPEVKRKL
ncbi:LOW QUALITY PROTEIN: SH2 domain-containing protein 7 [Pseudoliparis swirei]|uniref:LOW QUALITY PROTEIN: SH2 domain-containing protein 7 n=1 Tax=Pseudoliparis swirei TaxID=2059687 RepID=UPI0024BE5658|nr:LOW QUALITY PROTEIN: SH2 domain-containing protein 7 [Pseudoliparis swirei]